MKYLQCDSDHHKKWQEAKENSHRQHDVHYPLDRSADRSLLFCDDTVTGQLGKTRRTVVTQLNHRPSVRCRHKRNPFWTRPHTAHIRQQAFASAAIFSTGTASSALFRHRLFTITSPNRLIRIEKGDNRFYSSVNVYDSGALYGLRVLAHRLAASGLAQSFGRVHEFQPALACLSGSQPLLWTDAYRIARVASGGDSKTRRKK